ncbi:hypothetical protein NE237_006048 [Protea cynaroides]|uniref:RING-type E3 ubiquitin transferase n=1 Tax=Protea cynaroides TaxID=273540 RepID=A0A9Q0KLV6_9MAGN|nr:hypothetical protein NE237_006048 [Protea cynaroides]
MSSAGAVGAAAASQLYFCYQCNRTVSITPSPTFDLVCPDCNGGFLEEYENPTPTPTPTPNPFFTYSESFSGGGGGGAFPSLAAGLAGLPFLLSSSSSIEVPADLSALFDPEIRQRSTAAGMQDSEVFNPFLFLQNYIQSLRAGGANIQFVIENNPSDSGGFRLPANLGDYFIGPGLEQLIQQLAENDPNRYGTPPASKSAVEALPIITMSKELLASDSAQCAVLVEELRRILLHREQRNGGLAFHCHPCLGHLVGKRRRATAVLETTMAAMRVGVVETLVLRLGKKTWTKSCSSLHLLQKGLYFLIIWTTKSFGD